jgi:hypothetical protein
MARPIYEYTLDERGSIEVVKNQKGYNVIFTPPKEALPRGHDPEVDYKRLIALMNLEQTAFTFFPFKGRGLYAMEPKYLHLTAITVEIQNYVANELDVEDIEDLFAKLPDVFIENYNYGLGFLKKYNQIASFIEMLGAKHLYIMKRHPTTYDRELEVMTINEKDLRTLQKNIDKISARASRISLSTKHDVVAEILLELISRSTGHQVSLQKTNVNERISRQVLRL